jgi:Uma2 family endonuclease
VTVVDTQLLARAQHAVDEVLPEGITVEVLEGMLVVNPPPSFNHGVVTGRVGRELERLAPSGLTVEWGVMGVWEHDSSEAEYQIPDVVVYRTPEPGAARLAGGDVEAVVEVVSPANRRLPDYEGAVADRAERYRIPWVLIIDPDKSTLQWYSDGKPHPTGPDWAAGLDSATLFG